MTDQNQNAASGGNSDPGWEANAPNAYKWTTAAYDLLLAEKLHATIRVSAGVTRATAHGECPRCHDQFTWNEVLDAVVGENIRTLGVQQGDAAGYIGLTVACRCTEPHVGRPAGVTDGCGINFRVEVLARGDAS